MMKWKREKKHMSKDSRSEKQNKSKNIDGRKCLFHPALQCPNADGKCVFTNIE